MSKLVVLDERRKPAPPRSIRPSRFTTLVPLADGGSVAWNSLSGSLAVWTAAETRAFQGFQAGEDLGADDKFLDKVWRARHVVERDLDEVEIARSYYDQERYGQPTLTLANFVRGPEHLPAQKPMSANVRGAITAVADKMSGTLRNLHAIFVGHEPLQSIYEVGDLSLRLAEISLNRKMRYSGAVQTNGVALAPKISAMLPSLEIKHVEILVRSGAGVLDALGLVIENLHAALATGRLDVRVRLETQLADPQAALTVLEKLAEAGLAKHEKLTLDLHGGVFTTCHRDFGIAAAGNTGTKWIERARGLGFETTPELPRFMSHCQAVRSLSYVVAPNGDLHKCWSTVGDAAFKIGNATVPNSYNIPIARRPKWMTTDAFSDKVCSECSILPLCAGRCADLYPSKSQAQLDPARPCPDLKLELSERILAAARIAGVLPRQGESNGQV